MHRRRAAPPVLPPQGSNLSTAGASSPRPRGSLAASVRVKKRANNSAARLCAGVRPSLVAAGCRPAMRRPARRRLSRRVATDVSPMSPVAGALPFLIRVVCAVGASCALGIRRGLSVSGANGSGRRRPSLDLYVATTANERLRPRRLRRRRAPLPFPHN